MSLAMRRERDLAEIKGLVHELSRRLEDALEDTRSLQGKRPASARRDKPRRDKVAKPGQVPVRITGTAGSEASKPAAPRPSPLLAFVHVPKTAGGSVKSMFVASYSGEEVRDTGNYSRAPKTTEGKLTSRRIREARVAIGHVPYGLLREHLPDDTRYMTFMREPVDRVLSHYYRHRAKKPSLRGQAAKSTVTGKITAASVEEALAEPPSPELSNLATRYLCGHRSPMGELPASALDDAKANLREFAFVGIQERFDESLALLQRMLDLEPVSYENRHVSSSRPAVDGIPAEERARIEERNQLDAELYRFALELFEEALERGRSQ